MHGLAAYPLRFFLIVCALLAAGFMSASAANAQFAGSSTGISLTLQPAYPEPNALVTVSLDDYSTDTTGASVTWYVDGVEKSGSRNERSITITTGAPGAPTTITVRLDRQGTSLSATRTIRPVDVNIVLESDTYTPSFYKGRALPSADASIRAVAVVNDGQGISWNTYSYKWTFADRVVQGGALKGRYAIDLTMPQSRGGYLTVEVYDLDGTIVGRKTIFVQSVTPELLFYEYSPLRGLVGTALSGEVALPGTEATFYAEPFFLNKSRPDARNATFSWTLNDTLVAGNTGTPNALTLAATGERGRARITASVLTNEKIPQFTKGSFTLVFE